MNECPKMVEYVSTTLVKLKSDNYCKLNLIIGNESGDLDSAVSALLYATYLNWQYDQNIGKVSATKSQDLHSGTDEIFVPILMVEREDYALKTEVKFCLDDHGIKESDLVFNDDIDMKELVFRKKTNVILVDHHILSDKYSFLTPFVTEIIDHRPRNNVDWRYKDDVRSTIELVGSCATLVAKSIKDSSALLSSELDFFVTYPVCCDLLYSVIILDTVNFCKTLNKATPLDEEIVLFLEGVMKLDNVEDQRKTRLDRLVAARSDVSSLTPGQLMRKDLKTVEGVLVPSFPILVEEFLNKPESVEAVNDALKAKRCKLALLLGMDLKEGLKRDGAIYPISDETDRLLKYLQSWTKPALQLEVVEGNNCLYFKQCNLSASRKQYMPALIQFLNEK